MSFEVRQGDCVELMAAMPAGSVDAVVCDPPYLLGFMGKSWDRAGGAAGMSEETREAQMASGAGWTEKPYAASARPAAPAPGEAKAMQEWHEAWATEALRVLKPGGHLLAFGGTRTYHRLVCAVEDAGFEIRDTISWLYGSGFPKSLDVSKAIDRADDSRRPEREAVGRWLRDQREAAGLKQKEVAAHWPSVTGGLTGCVANWEGGFNCPTLEQWVDLKRIVGLPDDMDAEVWRLNGRKGQPGENWELREKVGDGVGAGSRGNTFPLAPEYDLTAPATPEAERWEGWGTALKPAHEPVVVARKPLSGGRRIDVRVNVENGLRDRGVEGEIRWTRPVSGAATPSPTKTSGSTSRRVTGATSARTASASATPPTETRTESGIGKSPETGEPTTSSTPELTSESTTDGCGSMSSPRTEGSAPVAGSPSTNSSPSITSTEGEAPTVRPSTARSTSNSDAKASQTVTESFAGIATGLTGSQAHAHINRLSDGTFEWPDGLSESVGGGSGTVAGNVLEHGTGALNVDGCRVGMREERDLRRGATTGAGMGYHGAGPQDVVDGGAGRWPANVVLSHTDGCVQVGTRKVKGSAPASGPTLSATESVAHGDYAGERGAVPSYQEETVGAWSCTPDCPVRLLDEQTGELGGGPARVTKRERNKGWCNSSPGEGVDALDNYGDTGGASRFFYVAKASRGERNAGLEGFEEQDGGCLEGNADTANARKIGERPDVPVAPTRNGHPTVKPISLMRWLVRLVTPPGGTVLDPFCGSGTTGCACALEAFDFIGLEREPEYVAIAEARIAWWHKHRGDGEAAQILAAGEARDEVEATGQLGMFD